MSKVDLGEIMEHANHEGNVPSLLGLPLDSLGFNGQNQVGEENWRFIVLILFLVLTGSNAFQWVQYTMVSEQVKQVFNETLPSGNEQLAIDTTATVFMISYSLLIIPSYFLLYGKSLRLSILLGSFLNTLGTFVKCFAQRYRSFGLLMFGQSISATAQTFTLGQPSHLAALWFRQEIVSLVAGIGVFANQLGIAFGFLMPSIMLNSVKIDQQQTPGQEYIDSLSSAMLYKTAIPLCAVAALNLLLVLLFFKKNPRIPASNAELKRKHNKDTLKSILKRL